MDSNVAAAKAEVEVKDGAGQGRPGATSDGDTDGGVDGGGDMDKARLRPQEL
jgi:hypothetical protein